MNQNPRPRMTLKKFLALATGVVVFAFLMAIRPEFSTMWSRAFIAGAAGGYLMLFIYVAKCQV